MQPVNDWRELEQGGLTHVFHLQLRQPRKCAFDEEPVRERRHFVGIQIAAGCGEADQRPARDRTGFCLSPRRLERLAESLRYRDDRFVGAE